MLNNQHFHNQYLSNKHICTTRHKPSNTEQESLATQHNTYLAFSQFAAPTLRAKQYVPLKTIFVTGNICEPK